VALPDGGKYFNTGTWLPGGSEARAFTHLIISGDGEPQAELCQWLDGASVLIYSEP
jgi:hypothetical protein